MQIQASGRSLEASGQSLTLRVALSSAALLLTCTVLGACGGHRFGSEESRRPADLTPAELSLILPAARLDLRSPGHPVPHPDGAVLCVDGVGATGIAAYYATASPFSGLRLMVYELGPVGELGEAGRWAGAVFKAVAVVEGQLDSGRVEISFNGIEGGRSRVARGDALHNPLYSSEGSVHVWLDEPTAAKWGGLMPSLARLGVVVDARVTSRTQYMVLSPDGPTEPSSEHELALQAGRRLGTRILPEPWLRLLLGE